MSRLAELTPYLAIGAAASVPFIVAASEQQSGRGKQLQLEADSAWPVPATTACLEKLAALLTEAAELLGAPVLQAQGNPQRGAPAPCQPAEHAADPQIAAASPQLTQQHGRSHQLSAAAPLALPAAAAAAARHCHLPGRVLDDDEAAQQLGSLTLPAAADSSVLGSRASAAAGPSGGSKVMSVPRVHQQSAAALAREHPGDMAVMRQALCRKLGQEQLLERFSDAELMRYAITKGYLRAESQGERQLAMQQAVAAAASTLAWLQSHPFASDEELAAYGHLLWWTEQHSGGIPVLHIAIGRAVNECRGPAAVAFANAIVTQLQRAVEGMLGDDGRRPDRLVVVMDCSGVSALSATRIASVFKAVCASLNHHYPCRLHELVLIDVPAVLTWLVAGIKKLVHPETRQKVRVVRDGRSTAPAAAGAE